jgi:hypothetical protein
MPFLVFLRLLIDLRGKAGAAAMTQCKKGNQVRKIDFR